MLEVVLAEAVAPLAVDLLLGLRQDEVVREAMLPAFIGRAFRRPNLRSGSLWPWI